MTGFLSFLCALARWCPAIPPAPTETLTVTIDNTGGNANAWRDGTRKIPHTWRDTVGGIPHDQRLQPDERGGLTEPPTLVQEHSKRLSMEPRSTPDGVRDNPHPEQYRATELGFYRLRGLFYDHYLRLPRLLAVPISETGRPAYAGD